MKILPFLLFLTASSVGLTAAQIHSSPQSAYAQAVKSYVEAATQEISAIRASVDAQVNAAPETQRKGFDAVYKKLDRCDRLIADLKAAGPATFDKVKIQFERARAEAVKALTAAQS